MNLHELASALPGVPLGRIADIPIADLTNDSRRVVPGAMFVAVRGSHTDGHRFLADAARRGAAALVGEQSDPGLGVPYIRVKDSRQTLAHLAAAWNGYPARKLVMIGVTGTDGKTTTCSLIHHILLAAGRQAAMVTSVEAVIGDEVLDTGFHVTTPSALELQAILARMIDAGMGIAVVEATSHGLAQKRVAACDFDLAAVTNITHEHLDFHKTFEAYRDAKAGLFTELDLTPPKEHGIRRLAVLNRDDASFGYLDQITRSDKTSYGLGVEADIRATGVSSSRNGLEFRIEGDGYDVPVRTPIIGVHNVSNFLAAFAVVVAGLGIPPETAAQAMAGFPGVPGRMERIDLGQDFSVIVDFAHTPNALARALETARGLTQGRVIVVFGSAGLRDVAKRRLMPQVAAGLADLTILTAEDPRIESLESILDDMGTAMREASAEEGRSFIKVPDRGEAIRAAIGQARADDLVIICGKGHEQSMCFGEIEYPWDDRQAARAALAEILGVRGPQMPILPTSTRPET
jgi:UDP-N-acetylmuramoyl-L-alanyl-D-glutamate--2,6-diaminopimelate ligase